MFQAQKFSRNFGKKQLRSQTEELAFRVENFEREKIGSFKKTRGEETAKVRFQNEVNYSNREKERLCGFFTIKISFFLESPKYYTCQKLYI